MNTRLMLDRPGVMTARMNAAALALEAFAVFFATLAAVGLNRGSDGPAWIWGVALTLWCFVAAGMARSSLGLVLGALTQLVLVGFSTQVDLGLIVAVIFAALWGWLVWIGLKIDRDRAAPPAEPDIPG